MFMCLGGARWEAEDVYDQVVKIRGLHVKKLSRDK